jgi:hypothetical protein
MKPTNLTIYHFGFLNLKNKKRGSKMNIEIEKTGEIMELNLTDTFSLVKFIKYVMVCSG